MWELRFVGVAVCGSCGVWELVCGILCVGSEVRGNYGVRELRYVGVAMYGSHGKRRLWCGGDAIWGSIDVGKLRYGGVACGGVAVWGSCGVG